ncbi:type II CRISPR RNA-guided endonuclease Cas9 [Streptococcus caprae]|uniref:CRISPR-associated endonuclease Cas9 n=1 Tax=Streptococcus caprae TaxID=1640501 RepID=A0ABV8CVG8_9STRE
MQKPYTIGLDIGTNSVGWSVITDDYKVPAKKMVVRGNTDKTHIKKNLMGVLLFDEGQVAADRRQKRVFRRRIARRKNRLRYLQEIFASEMAKVDVNFFHRLEESFLHEDDKRHGKYSIFGTLAEEKAYYEEFPTIYHLRKHLADHSDKADLRLIYLALAHIIKYRGHFLIEGKINADNPDVQPLFNQFIELFDALQETQLASRSLLVDKILTEKMSKSRKVGQVLDLVTDIDPKKKAVLKQFLALAVGLTGNFKVAFGLDEEAKLQLSKDTYEEELAAVLAKVEDSRYEELFATVKKLSDAILLSGILQTRCKNTHAKLSASMVERYEEHEKDLAALKHLLRGHREIYHDVFKDETKNGYAGYIERNVSQEEFYKYMKTVLSAIEGSQVFLEKMEQENFLRKQRTFDNGAIPNQIHLKELRAILKQQGKHYPFLADNQAKIEQILTFRIPYYVGPLANGQSSFAWLKRRSDEAVRPWNFEEVVDKEASATAFINKLTNNDLYLPDKKVLPKHSLLYETFMVYNELTKIRYVDEQGKSHFFDANMKQEIFDGVFKENRKVTAKHLKTYLANEFPEYRITDLLGLDKDKSAFNASLGTYHDLKKILGRDFLDNPEHQELLEDVVHTLTVFEDKEMITNRLSKHFSGQELRQLTRRHYTGWGQLSRQLIHGIKDKQSRKTILDYLIDDGRSNRNFMQLINDDALTFKDQITKAQESQTVDDIQQVVADLPGSPAIKKGILQTIKIVDELIAVMGYAPEHIVVEMARENQTTARGRRKSEERKKMLETALNEFGSHILPKDLSNDKLRNDRLYLYYLQNGKDMYTGEELDINRLSSYDIDHIIPQSFIKDDSLDNRVLTSSEKNRGKLDDVPSEAVVQKMRPFWDQLLRSKLITQRKYNNLTRGKLSEEVKKGFIKRQLVETRQITKHVARLLDERFNPTIGEDGKRQRTVAILTLKSSLTSQFRKMFDLYKVREINDYHHAHDAYLNAVVGKALLIKYPQLAPEFVYGEYAKIYRPKSSTPATEKVYLYTNVMKFFQSDEPQASTDGETAWIKDKHIGIVKKVLSYPQVNVVKKTEVQTVGQNGGLFDNNLVSPKKVAADKLIPIKQGLSAEKYGGYSKPTTAYPILLVADTLAGKSKKAKQVKELYPISVMDRQKFESDPIAFLEEKGYHNVKLSNIVRLPKYSLIDIGQGIRRMSATAKEIHKGNQMILSKQSEALLYHANRRTKPESLEYLQNNQAQFDVLLNEMMHFAKKTYLSKPHISKLEKIYTDKAHSASIEELATSFIELFKFTSVGASSPFVFLGEKLNQKQYTGDKDYISPFLNGTLIHQSVTGLYETRIDLSKLGDD